MNAIRVYRLAVVKQGNAIHAYWSMILIQRRFSNVSIWETEICPTLENAMGAGGGNIPIIYDERTDCIRNEPDSCDNNE